MTEQDWQLGEIKFFDNDKGFGFVKNIFNGEDYFVHISKIKTIPINDNDKVAFQYTPSRKKPGTFEAKNVTLLSEFKSNTDFLILQFSQLKDLSFRKAILKALPINCVTFIIEQELVSQKSISNDIEYKDFIDKSISINNIFEGVFTKEKLKEIIGKHVEEITTNEYRVQLWLENIINSEPELILIKNYFVSQNRNIQEKIYSKLNRLSKIAIYKAYIDKNNLNQSLNNSIYFLQLEKNVEVQKEIMFLLTDIFSYEKINLADSIKVYEVLTSVVNGLDKVVGDLFISFFYSVSADYIKLKLWLSDLINKKDYDIYQSNFIFLSTVEQQRFIKKLFYLLSKKADNITYERILALKNLTYSFTEGKKFQLDFSCNIILASIDCVKRGNFLNKESIFSILTRHVENDTDSLLMLNGFFEKCNGISIPNETRKSEEGGISIVSLKTIPIPRNVEFCEGVRFKEDGKDRTYKHDCWWCRGGSCYAANQLIQLPSHYNDFTLANFFTILNIQFDAKEYFDFLGLLNKINVYLKHINCRSYNHILKPFKEGYYSYYRISNFICSNLKCDNKKNVYLNHCLGAKKTAIKSRCDNLIDSRDTVRCNYTKHNPSDINEKYGPYICNLCGSCCSQKSLEKKYNELYVRKWNMQPGLEWKVKNKVGHLEKEEIFCYKCGIEMINNEQEYKSFITRLENPDNSFKVLKKGTNNYGFLYMVKADEDFFEKALQIGFRVSETNGNESDVKFVAQGNINFLICQNCNTKYNKLKVEFVIEKENVPI